MNMDVSWLYITEFTTTYGVRKRCYSESLLIYYLSLFNHPFLYVFADDKVGRILNKFAKHFRRENELLNTKHASVGVYNPCIKRGFHLFSGSNDYD